VSSIIGPGVMVHYTTAGVLLGAAITIEERAG
jgi:hypothetical protein